jgi:hypothetical protein
MGEFDPKVYRQKLAFIKNDIATQGRKFEGSRKSSSAPSARSSTTLA